MKTVLSLALTLSHGGGGGGGGPMDVFLACHLPGSSPKTEDREGPKPAVRMYGPDRKTASLTPKLCDFCLAQNSFLPGHPLESSVTMLL